MAWGAVEPFCITRQQFLDRIFTIDELAALVEMLRLWRLGQSRGCEGEVFVQLECRISWFARSQMSAIQNALGPRLGGLRIEASNPDEIQISGPRQCITEEIDLIILRECLCEILLNHVCLMLRLTFSGPLNRINGSRSNGNTTFVFFGSPLNGAFMAKALWTSDGQAAFERIYRLADWEEQAPLLEAFEFYLGQCTLGSRESAAALALKQMPREGGRLFFSSNESRLGTWFLRQFAELPDDRQIGGFVKRMGVPLALGASFIAISFIPSISFEFLVLLLLVAGTMLFISARVALKKFQRVKSYHTAMRKAKNAFYSNPFTFKFIDLSEDLTPSLLKCCRDLEDMGATRVCDYSIATGAALPGGSRRYALGSHSVSVALLRKFIKHDHFPALPVLSIFTKFQDGWIHRTFNHPIRRRNHNPNQSIRCLAERGELHEMIDFHLRHVDKLIAGGKVPAPPASTGQAVMQEHEKIHEQGKELWKKYPYSWKDAVYDAFKLCPRENLRE